MTVRNRVSLSQPMTVRNRVSKPNRHFWQQITVRNRQIDNCEKPGFFTKAFFTTTYHCQKPGFFTKAFFTTTDDCEKPGFFGLFVNVS